MQDDRTAHYRQAAIVAREKATTAIDPNLWLEIANDWERLASLVETVELPDNLPEPTFPASPR